MSNDKNDMADKIYKYKEKWDYFWDYYKIYFLLGVGLLIFIIFVISQYAGKIDPDVNIAYIGPQNINADVADEITISANELTNEFNTILGTDLNGDRKVMANFISFYYIPSGKIKEYKNKGLVIDTQFQASIKKQFDIEILSGNSVIYLLDKGVYEDLQANKVFVTLSYVLGYLPENAIDEYHIMLSDLPAYKYFPSLGMFPEDTVIAVRGEQTMNLSGDKSSHDDRHDRNHEMFKKIIEFKAS